MNAEDRVKILVDQWATGAINSGTRFLRRGCLDELKTIMLKLIADTEEQFINKQPSILCTKCNLHVRVCGEPNQAQKETAKLHKKEQP